MAASPVIWTKELDLKLIQTLQDFLGTEFYDAEKTKIDWQKVFKATSWPEGFTRETLKSRWGLGGLLPTLGDRRFTKESW